MQLEATLNLEELTAAEIAEFEIQCRKKKTTPEKQAARLIRDFTGPKPRPARKSSRRKVA